MGFVLKKVLQKVPDNEHFKQQLNKILNKISANFTSE
jgi:hypothetical protein